MSDYPKMLYGPYGDTVAIDADMEAKMREAGQMSLAELSAQNGRDTAPAAPPPPVYPWDVGAAS